MSWPLLLLALLVGERVGSISLSASVLDFGEAVQGDLAMAELELRNISSQWLRLHPSRADCGCMLVPEIQLAPRGAARVTIRLDTARVPVGFVRRYFALEEESHGLEATVELRGHVLAPFRVVPRVLEVAPRARKVRFEVHGALPFEVIADETGLALPVRTSHRETVKHFELNLDTESLTSVSEVVLHLRHRLGESRLVLPLVRTSG